MNEDREHGHPHIEEPTDNHLRDNQELRTEVGRLNDAHDDEVLKVDVERKVARAESDAGRNASVMKMWLSFTLIALGMLLTSLFFSSRTVTDKELRNVNVRVEQGIQCLLSDLSDHRENQYALAEAEAKAQGRTVTRVAPGPLETDKSAAEACAAFLMN